MFMVAEFRQGKHPKEVVRNSTSSASPSDSTKARFFFDKIEQFVEIQINMLNSAAPGFYLIRFMREKERSRAFDDGSGA